MTKFDILIARVTEALEAGFTSKAGVKRAGEDLNRAFDLLKGEARERMLDAVSGLYPNARTDEAEGRARIEHINGLGYWDLPDYPHLIRDAHLPLFADRAPEVEQVKALRAALVAAPVVPVERDTMTVREVAVREDILSLMTRRGEQYNRALDLAERFGGLPVSANVHVCTNEHGTQYIRAFYYLAGEFTALGVILAAADELARRAEA